MDEMRAQTPIRRVPAPGGRCAAVPLAREIACWAYDHMQLPLPERHRYPRRKYHLVREQIVNEGTLPPEQLHRAEPEDWAALALVHDESYLERLREGTLSRAEEREIGLPFTPHLVDRSRAAVHGTVQAALSAVRHGAAANLGGGNHHAFAARGSGYCVLNDIAVAIRTLQHYGHAHRIAIVDLDVHQGNANAAIFTDDANVFTCSLHGARNWPYRKERSDLDVELPDATGDLAYLAALAPALDAVFDGFRPEAVFFQAGADPLAEDRLGRLALTLDGLRQRDAMVLARCHAERVPVVVTLGGGYGVPIELTVEAHANTLRELARIWRAAPA
jgi:acetoin utilization deacetylase AcuC-like enzyme